MRQRLLAIWKYDDDIGYLCGEIVEFTPKGNVRVIGYDGYVFKPLKILPYDPIFETKLNELKAKYREERNELRKTYKKQFEDFVGGIDKHD